VTPWRAPTSRFVGWATLLAVVPAVFVASAWSMTAPDAASRPAARNFPGGPYFTVVCGFSHRNNDDPILFPGKPGRSHNHTFIGNRVVDASTTAASLRDGTTTCDLDLDSSTYWVPTVYVGREPVTPLAAVVYYTNRTSGSVVAPPAGLKMLAGNPFAKRPQAKGIASWSCGGVGGTPRFAAISACAQDDALELNVLFPNCWNGRQTDSANHKRHMAYSSPAGRCPASHPVRLPTITLVLLYPPIPRGAQPSSGKFSAHADFINGWDQNELARLVAGLNV
jgi:Domain of unknown function (DUF1996)